MEQAKILVVDQGAIAYEPLKPGLAKYGYHVHTTTTVSQALDFAGAHRYRTALVSLAFIEATPLIDGLHTEFPELPIIAVTGPDCEALSTSVAEVVDNVVNKPLDLEALRLMLDHADELAVLREVLRHHRDRGGMIQLSGEDDPLTFDDVFTQKLRAIVLNMRVLGHGSLHRAVLSYVEKLLLSIVLSECRGNQVKSARLLGINRNTLRKKLREFDLPISRRSV